MKDEDLETTKPIQMDGEAKLSREEKYEDVLEDEVGSREEKYQKMLEEEKNREAEEEAEKALAQKNIELAEEYEKEELEAKEQEEILKAAKEETGETKKEKPLVKLKNWWNSLDKTQKIIYGIIGALFLILLILLLIGVIALIGKKKPEEKPKEEVPIQEEAAPIMFDNYYYKDGTLYFLSEGGSDIGTYACNNKSEKLCAVAVNNYRDGLDVPNLAKENGEEVIEHVKIVQDDFVFINDTDTEGKDNIILYSIKKNEKIAQYQDVKAYDNGYYAVKDTSGKYGLIQIVNEKKDIIKPQYSYLGMIDGENYLVAKEAKGFIVIDKKDKGISKYVNVGEVKYYNNNFIVTKNGGTYGVYDYKGKQLRSGATFITVKGKYIFEVEEGKVFVYDAEGNKFTEEGVSLNNGEYVKTFVYDDNDQLVTVKRSFETEVKANEITIGVYNSTFEDPQYSNLNIHEGNLNKNYDFVNYFDGILYFYTDEEKTYLIGSYTCANKNEVTASSKEFTSCYLAKDTVFEDNVNTTQAAKGRKARTPIISNKYVFVKDGDNNIVLYDIEARTNKSSYQKVNTYTADNDYKVTATSGKLSIVAFNKKGKYGVIRIENSNVSPLYAFNYNKIEKLGDYFIGLDTAGKWLIFANGKTNGVYDEKVAGYTDDLKHVKAFNKEFYSVYSFEGEKIAGGLYYVELFENAFVRVDEEKNVAVYGYDGTKLSESAQVFSDVNVKANDKQLIRLKKTDAGYVVSIFDGKDYKDTTLPFVSQQHEEQG